MQTHFKPDSMNIELTTNCPLQCPQCYCALTGGLDIDLEKAKYWLTQAGEMGVTSVCLSGGETLCYPYIFEVVQSAAECCGEVYVALSGYNFTEDVFEKLIAAGVSGIFISLNGSTEKINSLNVSVKHLHFGVSKPNMKIR